jgi:glycosyltransferase involved in cell wall biosynthesis
MTRKKVSFIVPNFNNDKYLVECLDSIFKQSYRPIEVVVIDDASSDDSVKVLSEYNKSIKDVDDFELIVCLMDQNYGVANARKKGMDRATGSIISTIDPDDYLIDFRITELAVECIAEYKKKGIDVAVGSITTIVDGHGGVVRLRGVQRLKNFPSSFDLLSRKHEVPGHFYFLKSIFSNYISQQSGCLYEDLQMKMDIANKYGFVFLNRQGLAYRQHMNGLSSVGRMKQISTLLNIYIRELKNFSIFDFRHIRFYFFILYILVKYKK